jgi:hypothetical protein
MHFTSLTLICLCMVMTTGPVLAKEKKPSQMDHQAMMETYKKLATPGEPHKQLASLAGKLDYEHQVMDGTQQASDGIRGRL